MPRRFFRKFAFKRDRIHRQWYMAPFRHLLQDHRLWAIRRRTVVPACALGIFVAFQLFPGHMLVAILLAVALRVNVPAAALSTLVVNPVTLAPIFYFCYETGLFLLGLEPQHFEFELSLNWLGNQFLDIWQPLLLGCLLVGAIASLITFIGLDLLWRASIADYLAKRRAKRAAKT